VEEWQRSNPDIKVFVPKEDMYEGDNEHFLVFPIQGGEKLLAIWTQSSVEGYGDNHLVMAESSDSEKWSEPWYVAGAKKGQSKGHQASWGFPIVADTGRIYVFYTKDVGLYDFDSQTTGTMGIVYSDDCGKHFTDGEDILFPRTPFDHPDSKIPPNFIVWQKPIKDSKGRFFAGYTRWSSEKACPQVHDGWFSRDSRVHFMRFDNIHEGPDPKNIKITFLPGENVGLTVGFPGDETVSVAQEPSIVLLPDNRIFCVMRTFTGYIWYCVSSDDGNSWTKPEVLRYRDDGEKIKQPIASCPVFPLSDGSFLLVFHNNDGNLGSYKPKDALYNRRPAYAAHGTFMPEAKQPVWFSEPIQMLDNDGKIIGPKGTCEIATYPSFTEFQGKQVLWYPDRKYFLLGKYITNELFQQDCPI
jgi:hypothetical protein